MTGCFLFEHWIFELATRGSIAAARSKDAAGDFFFQRRHCTAYLLEPLPIRIELTMTRYCPAYAMLSPTVTITERYEITDAASGGVTSGAVVIDGEGQVAP